MGLLDFFRKKPAPAPVPAQARVPKTELPLPTPTPVVAAIPSAPANPRQSSSKSRELFPALSTAEKRKALDITEISRIVDLLNSPGPFSCPMCKTPFPVGAMKSPKWMRQRAGTGASAYCTICKTGTSVWDVWNEQNMSVDLESLIWKLGGEVHETPSTKAAAVEFVRKSFLEPFRKEHRIEQRRVSLFVTRLAEELHLEGLRVLKSVAKVCGPNDYSELDDILLITNGLQRGMRESQWADLYQAFIQILMPFFAHALHAVASKQFSVYQLAEALSPLSPQPALATASPPASRLSARVLSRQLNDAAIAAVREGNMAVAQQKWMEAAKADPTFSAPPFNIAKFMLNAGVYDPELLHVIQKYIRAAERNALNGTDPEDTHILEKLPALEQQFHSRVLTGAQITPGTAVRCRRGSKWVRGVISEGPGVYNVDTMQTTAGPPIIELEDGSVWQRPIQALWQAIESGGIVIEG